ncbi:integration host factor subunit beta [Candidatus Pelagibacter sp.]|nr:integration host factor subunit beta [Candidatus Pelagibacter sp.]
MSTNKSEIIKKLSNNYPNFIKKDLKKLFDILILEIKNSLKRHERVELRDVFTLEPKLRKSRMARNPKTNEKIYVDEKYYISFRSSKKWTLAINNEK